MPSRRVHSSWLVVFGASLAALACGSSHGVDDGGIHFDAPPDATDAREGGDGRVPSCGDGILDPREQCDDHDTTAGDGCDELCRREAYCGDGATDTGEVCDDGNNLSGDGCRSDCQSDESCGNDELDVAAGERCDDGNTTNGDGCESDCQTVASCGDGGALDEGEACDDGNVMSWDGCSATCQIERSLVLDSLEIGAPSVGCDYSGDGEPDNSLSAALGAGRGIVSGMLSDRVASGEILLLLSFLGLDDPAAVADEELSVVLMPGSIPTGTTPAPDPFSGEAELYGNIDAFDADGVPVSSFQSTLFERSLVAGPEDVNLPVGFVIPLQLSQARVHGTTHASATDGELDAMGAGLLCGAVSVRALGAVPNPLGTFLPETPPPCDGSTDEGSLADVLVGGASVLGFQIGDEPPDVDIDGDGLESFEVDSGGTTGCQAVITACIDGDGTRVEGRACYLDSRFNDGYSLGMAFSAVRAHIIGLE